MKIVFATNNAHKLSEIRAILGSRIEILSLADIGCHVDIPETGLTLEENALQKARYVYDHYHLSCFADDTGLEVEALGGAPGVFSARYASLEVPSVPVGRDSIAASVPVGRDSIAAPVPVGRDFIAASVPVGRDSIAASVSVGRDSIAASVPVGRDFIAASVPPSHDSQANMSRLLRELGENNNRRARFRTVIALIEKEPVCPCGCTAVKREHLFEGIVEGQIRREQSGVGGFGYDPIFQPDGYAITFAEMTPEQKNTISHRARATAKLAAFLAKRNPGIP